MTFEAIGAPKVLIVKTFDVFGVPKVFTFIMFGEIGAQQGDLFWTRKTIKHSLK